MIDKVRSVSIWKKSSRGTNKFLDGLLKCFDLYALRIIVICTSLMLLFKCVCKKDKMIRKICWSQSF